MIERTCCVTGHRDILPHQADYVEAELRREVELAIAGGYTCFYCGFAQGVDMIFAAVVAEQCRRHPGVRLYAAIPHRGRYNAIMRDGAARQLLTLCRYVSIVSEGYSAESYALRNRYMVERSSRVIAVYDGRRGGGTAGTIKMALDLGREVKVISLQGGQ